MDISEILAKPGKEWTPEERRFVAQQMKSTSRQALKNMRDDIRNG